MAQVLVVRHVWTLQGLDGGSVGISVGAACHESAAKERLVVLVLNRMSPAGESLQKQSDGSASNDTSQLIVGVTGFRKPVKFLHLFLHLVILCAGWVTLKFSL